MQLLMSPSIEPMSHACTVPNENLHFRKNSEIFMKYWIKKSELGIKSSMISQICSISGSRNDLLLWTTNIQLRRTLHSMRNHSKSVQMQEIPSSTSSDDLEVHSLLANNSSDELSSWSTNQHLSI